MNTSINTIPKSQAFRQHFTLELPLKIKTSPQSLPTTNSIAESLSTSPRAIAFLNTEPGHSNSKRSTKDTALILRILQNTQVQIFQINYL